MRIVVTMCKTRSLKEYMKELCDRYYDIVTLYHKLDNMITFVNGDIIKGYSDMSRTDGVRADIVVGTDLTHITCKSKIENPIWDSEKLREYLDNIAAETKRLK